MLKKIKSVPKQIKNTLKSKKGFFVDTGVKILITVVLGALVLGGTYSLTKDTVMPNVKSKVESMFDYSNGAMPITEEPELEEKYRLNYAYTVYSSMEKSHRLGCTVDVKKFRKILIDGQEVDSSEYIMENCDYAYFFLKKTYFENLEHGMHTLKVIFDDGYAEGEFEYSRSFYFTVLNNTDQFAITGSTFDDWLWQTMMDYDTNGIVWKVNDDDKVYVDKNHTKYLKGVTWETKIEEGKVYNEVSQK